MRRSRGFTLVEILISLAITAMLMAMILGILVNVLFSAKRSEHKNAAQKIGHSILNLIQRDLESLYLPAHALAKDNNREYFRVEDNGDRDKMDFLTAVQTMPDENNKRTPIAEVGYRIVEHPTTSRDLYILFRREDIYDDDVEPLKGGKFIEIYDRIKKFNITCYDGTEWRDFWNWTEMKEKLPMAVKIEITISVDMESAESYLTDEELEKLERDNRFVVFVTLPLGEKIEENEEG